MPTKKKPKTNGATKAYLDAYRGKEPEPLTSEDLIQTVEDNALLKCERFATEIRQVMFYARLGAHALAVQQECGGCRNAYRLNKQHGAGYAGCGDHVELFDLSIIDTGGVKMVRKTIWEMPEPAPRTQRVVEIPVCPHGSACPNPCSMCEKTPEQRIANAVGIWENFLADDDDQDGLGCLGKVIDALLPQDREGGTLNEPGYPTPAFVCGDAELAMTNPVREVEARPGTYAECLMACAEQVRKEKGSFSAPEVHALMAERGWLSAMDSVLDTRKLLEEVYGPPD